MSKNLKRILMASVGAVVLAGAGAYGWYWFETGRFLESTDDAYVKADYTTIAPKVSGYIAEVAVEDNQAVKAGQMLARIDDRDYQTALAQAKADVASAQADIHNIDAQLTEQQSVIAQAEAAIVCRPGRGEIRAGRLRSLPEADRRQDHLRPGRAAGPDRAAAAERAAAERPRRPRPPPTSASRC